MVSTLLLNASFEPMKVIPWQRAITLLVLDKAELLEAYDDVVRGMSAEFQMPSVVRLRRFARGRRAAGVKFSRTNVYRRDEYTCQYCGAQPGASKLTFDHVVPRARGGRTEWTNIVTACVPCNARKADRTPEQARMTLVRVPARPAYMQAVGERDVLHDAWRDYLTWGSA
jgi:5-methylcytosine-specific restriction endonuclease McrA